MFIFVTPYIEQTLWPLKIPMNESLGGYSTKLLTNKIRMTTKILNIESNWIHDK